VWYCVCAVCGGGVGGEMGGWRGGEWAGDQLMSDVCARERERDRGKEGEREIECVSGGGGVRDV
jgi:hypothetical protein